MNKILIEIICSSTSKRYDFWVPRKMPIGLIIEKIAADICLYEENDELFDFDIGVFFYSIEQKMFLNNSQTMIEGGIKGGNRLLII